MIKHKQVLRQEMRQLRDNLTPEERERPPVLSLPPWLIFSRFIIHKAND